MKRNLFLSITALFFNIILISCSSDDSNGNNSNSNANDPVNNSIIGKWSAYSSKCDADEVLHNHFTDCLDYTEYTEEGVKKEVIYYPGSTEEPCIEHIFTFSYTRQGNIIKVNNVPYTIIELTSAKMVIKSPSGDCIYTSKKM